MLDLHQQKRVAAKLKKILVNTHLLDSQRSPPGLSNRSLQLRPRLHIIRLPSPVTRSRLREGGEVDFAAAGEGEAVEEGEAVWDHVVGQQREEVLAQPLGREGTHRARRGRGGVRLRGRDLCRCGSRAGEAQRPEEQLLPPPLIAHPSARSLQLSTRLTAQLSTRLTAPLSACLTAPLSTRLPPRL